MEFVVLKSRRHDEPCLRLFFFFVILGIILTATAISGCSAKNFSALRPGLETRGHYIENVPFHRQSESTCGPAALAGVFAYWGSPLDMHQITAGVYVPKLRGTLPMDMEDFARNAGFESTSSAGTLEDLKSHIRKGEPVICLLDLGFGLYHRPHYITVVGFDDVNAVIIGHDGVRANSVMGYDAFAKAWTRAGRWMLVIRPKGDGIKHEQ
jgi:ABC-type bacteriocin/lantibiotic exporter with double-glycine peptidase domain